ncbi:MAG: hypothetical protein JSW08_03015 [archaeon]|nr:MAG: hypothetical protein JSW08_03015 [archaeon]
MSEKRNVLTTKVVHSGIFDFKEIYSFLYDWLRSLQYTIVEGKYSEKIKPTGKEIGIEWACSRKVNDYVKMGITIEFKIKKMTDVEVTEDGVKIKKNKADIEIKIDSFLVLDYEDKWESYAISKFLRGVYDKYIIKNEIEGYEDSLGEEAEETANQIKAFLSLEGRK